VTTPVLKERSRRLNPLRLIIHQVKYEQLAFWSNRFGAIFTVGFSIVFLVFLGLSAGNSRIDYLGNIRLVVYYVPGFVAYGVMAACFSTLAIILVVRRETGLLKRLRLSPLPTWMLLAAIFVSTTIVALVQVILLLLLGRYGYDVNFPVSWAALAVALAVIFFVLLFLSGLYFPLKANSALAKISDYFPVRHFILSVEAPFQATAHTSPWTWHDLLVISIWGVAAAIVALRRFKWSPTRK
jgi:ABC-2 type transport system permease protein